MSDIDNEPRPVRDVEIASTRDGIDITRGYTGPLLIPADRVLRQRGGSDLSIYERVLEDPQAMSTFRDRRNAVVQCEWIVEAASDRRVDRKAADHLRLQLQRVGWDRVSNLMLYGIWYGFAVAEIMYGVEDGLITWDAIKVRNRRRFRFTPGGELRMLTFSNMFEGVELPPTKFWHFATGADNDDEPYGLGLGHWCYWPVLFKRSGLQFWLTFIEKYAAPTGVGEFDQAAGPEEQRKLLDAVRAIKTDSGLIIPKGMVVRLLEATRSGSVDYKALHDTMDATIAKTVVGQVASSQGTPGRLGNDDLQGDVRDDLVKADADLKCESLNLGPVRWLTRWNFPDADPPRVFRVTEEDEDLGERAKRDETIYRLGFKPSLDYVQSTYGGDWTERAPAPPDDPIIAVPPMPPAFAAAAQPVVERDRVDQLAPLLAAAAQPVVDDLVERARELVRASGSLDAIRDGLPSLFGAEPPARLTRALQDGLAVGRIAGQSDASDDSA